MKVHERNEIRPCGGQQTLFVRKIKESKMMGSNHNFQKRFEMISERSVFISLILLLTMPDILTIDLGNKKILKNLKNNS
jgi:hypothetical protein